MFLSRADYGEFLKTVSQAHDLWGVKDLVRSRRGEENEGRKVGMCLMKRLSDMTLAEAAREYGVKSYGAVGWACLGIHLKRGADRRFRRRLENPEDVICQQKI